MNKKWNCKNRIKHWNGYFYHALETENFVYYVNYREGDENGCVKMYRKPDLELVSDNIFAYNDMFEVLTEGTYTWISRHMKRNLKLHLEAEKINNEKSLVEPF
jgi:hypothetical protein